MLYSRAQTIALVIAVTVITSFELFMFVGTSMELVRDGRTDPEMWMLGWFQSVNARSAGLQVFDLKRLAKVMMVVYGFFMWLNPFPIVMAMERGAPPLLSLALASPAPAPPAPPAALTHPPPTTYPPQSNRTSRATRSCRSS